MLFPSMMLRLNGIDPEKAGDAWLTIPALVGPMIGPPLGGFITTYFSWHWIFIINVPIGVLGVALATFFIPEVPAERPPVALLAAPALEFLSPIKGPALEQFTVEVGSGIRPAAEAAALYDQDVAKQGKQLGLPNW